MAKGFVYIISNKAMPGLFKIGYILKDPALRAQELDSTGVPHPYLVEYEILVDDPYTLEQNVHRYLKEYNENKEWFRCNFDECVLAIHKSYRGNIYYERILKKERELEYRRKQAEEQKIQAEKERARRGQQAENERREREQQAWEVQKQKEAQEKALLDEEQNAYIQAKIRKGFLWLTLAIVLLAMYMSDWLGDVPIFLLVFLGGMLGVIMITLVIPTEEWKKDFLKNKKNNNPRLANIIDSIQRERNQQDKSD